MCCTKTGPLPLWYLLQKNALVSSYLCLQIMSVKELYEQNILKNAELYTMWNLNQGKYIIY